MLLKNNRKNRCRNQCVREPVFWDSLCWAGNTSTHSVRKEAGNLGARPQIYHYKTDREVL